MNKLIITGNGFDLAHKLPTSYSDFIKWFWNNICKNFENDLFSNLYYFNPEFRSRFVHMDSLRNSSEIIQKVFNDENCEGKIKVDIHDKTKLFCELELFSVYRNNFFKSINENYNYQNWVDIEMSYYKLLIDESLRSSHKIYSVKELNHQFEQVKNLFEYYLKEMNLSDFNNLNKYYNQEILNFLKPVVQEEYQKCPFFNNYINEFDKKYLQELNDDNEVIIKGSSSEENELKLPKALFLDFNYTLTTSLYVNELERYYYLYSNVNLIKIHGELRNKNNPINFGFGDEMDEQYKVLENYNDNEYLKNIKSFHYFYNQNYRDLMNWIELGNYQIIIMGHSCGLSDRTLLNTLFEHKNCASIKFFYYENEKGDNYTDIIQNISRHFDDKKVMRNKIVNKSLTKPLPQK